MDIAVAKDCSRSVTDFGSDELHYHQIEPFEKGGMLYALRAIPSDPLPLDKVLYQAKIIRDTRVYRTLVATWSNCSWLECPFRALG